LRLWNFATPNESKVLCKNKDTPPRAIVNVKERNVLFVSCGNKEGKGHIDAYDSKVNASYMKKATIENVYTEWRYGLIAMSKDYIVVSQEMPCKRICLIDVNTLSIVDTIIDNAFILHQGAMCTIKDNVAIYARQGKFFQLVIDNKHKLRIEHQMSLNSNDLRAGAGVAMLDSTHHFVSNSIYTQLIIYKLNY
jgi:hypothetical protein